MFITTFTIASHLSLYWTTFIQSMPPHTTSWRSILLLSSHLCQDLPSGFFPSGLPTHIPFSHTCHMHNPSHSLFDHANNICWAVQITSPACSKICSKILPIIISMCVCVCVTVRRRTQSIHLNRWLHALWQNCCLFMHANGIKFFLSFRNVVISVVCIAFFIRVRVIVSSLHRKCCAQ